jgi:Protein of unknown function (DUF3489)
MLYSNALRPQNSTGLLTLSIAKSRNPKSAAPKKGSAKTSAISRRKSAAAAAKTPLKADEPQVERVTKQERVLTLLNQAEGASIEEMMQATKWQQHSVRGLLAGTVKKKLGFSLKSSKPNGGIRRYRIQTTARSLTWTDRRSISQRRSRGFRS